MKSAAIAACLLLGATASQAAAPEEAALRRCRAIAEPAARLACYDALPLAAMPPAAPSSAAMAAAVPAAVAAPPAAVAPAANVAARPMSAPAPAPAPTAKASDFGLEAQRAAETQQISSHIAGTFDGWGPNTRITLANGQVWQVIDGSSGAYYLKEPRVTVTRAALGSFRLEIEGARMAPRVRRVE